jgi:hypothetical protein
MRTKTCYGCGTEWQPETSKAYCPTCGMSLVKSAMMECAHGVAMIAGMRKLEFIQCAATEAMTCVYPIISDPGRIAPTAVNMAEALWDELKKRGYDPEHRARRRPVCHPPKEG